MMRKSLSVPSEVCDDRTLNLVNLRCSRASNREARKLLSASYVRLASAVMSRTQLRHSSVDNSPMVISWRSRETDPSLTPTRDGSVFTTRFRFASAFDRRGDALGNGRKLTRVFSFASPNALHLTRVVSSPRRKENVSDGKFRTERDENAGE